MKLIKVYQLKKTVCGVHCLDTKKLEAVRSHPQIEPCVGLSLQCIQRILAETTIDKRGLIWALTGF